MNKANVFQWSQPYYLPYLNEIFILNILKRRCFLFENIKNFESLKNRKVALNTNFEVNRAKSFTLFFFILKKIKVFRNKMKKISLLIFVLLAVIFIYRLVGQAKKKLRPKIFSRDNELHCTIIQIFIRLSYRK